MNKLINCVEQSIASVAGLNKVIIAYSGGVDSHVLLHVCAQIKPHLQELKFKAIYVDHGLHDDSTKWSAHCEKESSRLDIDFMSTRVFAKDIDGLGPEQAARQARYGALAESVDAQTLLLVAQHQDDQAETLLLQLLRGSGVNGLASMPMLATFNAGYIARPFLACGQQDILEYARSHHLDWIEDPSNSDVSYDRNFLRQDVIPLIKKRWPAFSKTTARSAQHCAEASDLLADIATDTLKDTPVDELSVPLLQTLNDGKQRLVIRQWLSNQGIRMPSEKILIEIQKMVGMQDINAVMIEWAGHQMRLFDQRLFMTSQSLDVFQPITWSGERLKLPSIMGNLTCALSKGNGINKALWESSIVSVRCRQGGEVISLAGRSGRKKLKKLFHESKVFPWIRPIVPLVYLDDKLVAVGDIWMDSDAIANNDQLGYLIGWDHPRLRIK